MVTMEIVQEISTVARTATADSLTPTFSQRRISSTIAVQSGQMVVLGGLMSEQIARDKSSIPVLGKIPYLGDILAGNTAKARVNTEIIVFIQPVVIRDPQDASLVAEEVRARMQSLAPRPAAWDVQFQDSTSGTVKGTINK
jgi:general secretion pathway protein D